MIAVISVVLLLAACCGGGAAVLRVAGVLPSLNPAERLAWAFTLGFGLLGWMMFPIGVFGAISPVAIGALSVAMIPGLLFLKGLPRDEPTAADAWTVMLLAAIAAACAGDIAEGISPPADADSLAYHFAIPKQFLQAGRIEFIPRASDGAAPLLVQMTYLSALALGGEKAMTLWCMVTGWAASFLVYGASRRYMPVNWALLAALVVLTTPAVLYGAGTGQIEVRLMLFVVVSAFAVADAISKDQLRFAAVAGLAAGFMMASKFPGLIYAFSCGCVLLLQRGWLRHGAVFSVAALVAGSQWYGWNWWHTGDPVFPMLFGIVEYLPGVPWNAEQHAFMKEDFFGSEVAVPRTLLWLIAYPVFFSLYDHPVIEAGRVGFGPYLLVLSPFAFAGVLRDGSRFLKSSLFTVCAVAVTFYAVWFFIGPSQRVRHLLPIVPLILVATTVAAEWGTRDRLARSAVLGACVLIVSIQLAGQAVATAKFFPFALSGESRDEFLRRNVTHYEAVVWINSHLKPTDRILMTFRQLIYLIDAPVFYAHRDVEARVETRDTQTRADVFWRQLREQNITHVLIDADPQARELDAHAGYTTMVRKLVLHGCAEVVATIPVRAGGVSRTLPGFGFREPAIEPMVYMLALTHDRCRL